LILRHCNMTFEIFFNDLREPLSIIKNTDKTIKLANVKFCYKVFSFYFRFPKSATVKAEMEQFLFNKHQKMQRSVCVRFV